MVGHFFASMQRGLGWAMLGTLAAAASMANTAAASAPAESCPWTASVISTGLGSLENLGFDGTGGMLLSRTANGNAHIYRLEPDGSGAVVAPEIDAPGGIVIDGVTAYFTTGNSFRSGILGRPDGTIVAMSLDRYAVTTVANGLTMPNGMARLPDGDFVVSRNLGLTTGLTHVAHDGLTATPYAQRLERTNGVAYHPQHNAVITSLDLSPAATLAVIDVETGSVVQRINLGILGLIGFPDDLTVGPEGHVYLAMDLGAVVRVDLATGRACVIGTGLPLSTAVKFGSGPGWDSTCLYATSLVGEIRRLCPPGSGV